MVPDHKKLLSRTFRLAERGRGLVSPNPLVGAVVAQGANVVGEGCHRAFGMPHAEVEALKKAGEKAKGAVMYVNLEPCCHQGKTPPCTGAIAAAGIREVVCAMEDPNPLVGGKGFSELEKRGIKVRKGLLKEEAERLNRYYCTSIVEKRPCIILKWAQTLDGRIASSSGDSKWVTSRKTRDFVKNLRFGVDALLVGVETVITDNPSLGYLPPSFQTRSSILSRKRYYKVVCDPSLRTPLSGNIWQDDGSQVIIIVSGDLPDSRLAPYADKPNCRFIKTTFRDGRFDMREMLERMRKMDIGVIMVEGGGFTLTRFWEEGLADEVMIFMGNRILGGENSLPPIAGDDKEVFAMSTVIEDIETRMIGDDIFLRGRPCFQG